MKPNLLPPPEDEAEVRATCSECYGDGGDEDGRCASCKGRGWVMTTDPQMAAVLRMAAVKASHRKYSGEPITAMGALT